MKGSRGNVVREENMLPIEKPSAHKPEQANNIVQEIRLSNIPNGWLLVELASPSHFDLSITYYLTLTRNLVMAKLYSCTDNCLT